MPAPNLRTKTHRKSKTDPKAAHVMCNAHMNSEVKSRSSRSRNHAKLRQNTTRKPKNKTEIQIKIIYVHESSTTTEVVPKQQLVT